MQNPGKWSILGGDDRFVRLAALLAQREIPLRTAFLPDVPNVRSADFSDAVDSADVIILPLPAAADGSHLNASADWLQNHHLEITQLPTLYDLQRRLHKNQTVLGGMLPPWFLRHCRELGVAAADYFTCEPLTVRNVIPTVEGCLALLLSRTDVTLHGMNILVTGYGRIGRVLTDDLRALGAHVVCTARKAEDFAWMEVRGIEGLSYDRLPDRIAGFGAVVNTVPHLVLTEPLLRRCRPDCLLIDLASKPGGTDFDAAARLGLNVIHALALPGKTAPQSAAAYLCDTVLSLAGELRNTAG